MNEGSGRGGSPYGDDVYRPTYGRTYNRRLSNLGSTIEVNGLAGCSNASQYTEADRYKCGVDTMGLDVEVKKDSGLRVYAVNNYYVFNEVRDFLQSGSRDGILEYTISPVAEDNSPNPSLRESCNATIRWALTNSEIKVNSTQAKWIGVANRIEDIVCNSTANVEQYVVGFDGWSWNSLASVWVFDSDESFWDN